MCSLFFFFSSRRRHTRYIGDWSSDVCSSDLQGMRRQCRDVRIGDQKFPRRFSTGSRRVFLGCPMFAEIAAQDRVDAGAGILEQMVMNDDAAPRDGSFTIIKHCIVPASPHLRIPVAFVFAVAPWT